MLSAVYGPVSSWRLGRSLGIDVITPPKTCTFNCIYCQLGRTEIHIPGTDKWDKPLVTVDQVLDDLVDTVNRIDMTTVDFVTFSGTGEPTLNPQLGDIAHLVKKRIGAIPLAILTNASLLHRSEVRRRLSFFDLIVAKLDAGDDETFRSINRPADEKLDVENVITSISRLKGEIEGILALEVMLLTSQDGRISNVEKAPLRRLLDAILQVEPDLVQLEIPYRPPAERFVMPPPPEKLRLISQELETALGPDKLWIYGQHDQRGKQVSWFRHQSLEKEIINLLKRRPCRAVDISTSLGMDLSTIQMLITHLKKRNLITMRVSEKEKYYFHSRTPPE